jgi:hypothetical protein
MAAARTAYLRPTARKAMLLVLCPALFVGVACGQQSPGGAAADTPNIPELINKANEDTPAAGYFVQQLAQLHAVQAVPAFEQKFARSTDSLDKMQLASALIRLGDKNDTYWDYLVEKVNAALQNDAPSFMRYDAQGKSKPGPSPEFVEWADGHHIALQSAAEDAMMLVPGEIGLLAMTADKRAIPLLRQALLSRNYMAEIMAAMGLARVHDKESIPLIIEACRHAPAEAAEVIAEALVYFDDPDAQKAVDTYMTKEHAKISREARAKGTKPLG